MTLFRNIIKATDNIFITKRCFVLNKNNWNAESYFGSKIEVPSPPKRPLTAYMIFCKENRKAILKDNPSLSNPEQIKALAEKWSHLTEDMKKPYELSARQNTQSYGEEHKKFYESLSEEQKEELARLKAKKLESRRILRNKKALSESGMPKAPCSSYALFVQAEAKKKPSVKHATDFIRKVADLWKSLPEESKNEFRQQAKQARIRYAEDMKDWRLRMQLEGNEKVVRAYEELKGKVIDPQEEEEEEEEPLSPRRSVEKKSSKLSAPKN